MNLKPFLTLTNLGALLTFFAVAVLVAWMPETVPLHWNLKGEVNGTGSRLWILLLAALPLLTAVLLEVVPRLDPKRRSYEKHAKAYRAVSLATTLFLIVVVWLCAAAALGAGLPMTAIIPSLAGVLFIVIGNYLPQARFNYTFGIRTPWTLASEESWRRTHRLGGFLFVLMGAVFLGIAWLPFPAEPKWMVGLGILFVLMVWMFVYSYVVYRTAQSQPQNQDPPSIP